MPDAVVTCDAAGLPGEFNRTARDWHGVDPRAPTPESWAQHGATLYIRPSIGIAVQPGPLRDAARLMQAADEAMYRAKRRADLHFATLAC